LQNIDYPNKLNNIFEKLDKYNIKPIIVGGYVRDKILKLDSKDIDIELYGVENFEQIEKILLEFGEVNSVGKSFGVCKLSYENLDLDFSLPRRDSKVAQGHKGFEIQVEKSLNFTEAAQRRDFTINAIGYDVLTKEILDPYSGVKDLSNKLLRAVDLRKFAEDPLRVLRLVQFVARFTLKVEKNLLYKAQEMMRNELLHELPTQRISIELEKLFLKSKSPSIGLQVLKNIDGFSYFTEFSSLTDAEYTNALKSVDCVQEYKIAESKKRLQLMFSLLCSDLSQERRETLLKKCLINKKLIESIVKLLEISFSLEEAQEYDLYLLATQVEVELYLYYLKAKYHNRKNDKIDALLQQAKELNILHKKLPPLVEGKDLIALGFKASKEFGTLLHKLYDLQMKNTFSTKESALTYLQQHLL